MRSYVWNSLDRGIEIPFKCGFRNVESDERDEVNNQYEWCGSKQKLRLDDEWESCVA